MKLNYNKIEKKTVGETIKFDSVRLTRDEQFLAGGVKVSKEEWLRNPELKLTNPTNKNKTPESILQAPIISNPAKLREGEVIVLDGAIKTEIPFRVEEVSEIGVSPQKEYCITVIKPTGEYMYLYVKQSFKNTFTLHRKPDPTSSGFTVKIKRAPTLYTVIKIGGKQMLTEFELIWSEQSESSHPIHKNRQNLK